jgi:hypothetical protein
MNLLVPFIVSAVSGLYTSLWGAFKDCPYEGFKAKTFPRSLYFNAIIFFAIYFIPVFNERIQNLSLFQTFFLVMGLERGIAEFYKGFLRTEDQKKYFVPSRITFFGRYVANDMLRRSIGIIIIFAIFLLLFLDTTITTALEFVAVSYAAGAVVACGGAYKDAPFEGFKILKFQKSPLVLSPLFFLFYSYGPTALGILICMNFGLERFVVEYYKTYIQRNMSGKFKPDLKRIQKQLETREKFHYSALVIIVCVIILFIYETRAL